LLSYSNYGIQALNSYKAFIAKEDETFQRDTEGVLTLELLQVPAVENAVSDDFRIKYQTHLRLALLDNYFNQLKQRLKDKSGVLQPVSFQQEKLDRIIDAFLLGTGSERVAGTV
jgi:hypothetical protein